VSAAASFVIVMNARSGKNDAQETAATIRRVLGGAARPCEMLLAEHPGELVALAQRAVRLASRHDIPVVAVGGDGTLNAVAQAALEGDRPFGAIPQGTFNYFARNYGIPLEPEAAAQALLDARVQPVQLGLVNDRVFLVNASLGLYPKILEDREEFKQRHGRSRLAALWSGLGTLLREQGQLALSLDQDQKGRALRTPTLVVGNNRLQLERIGIPEASSVEQGSLVAVAVKPVNTFAMYMLAVRGALGRLGEAGSVVSFAFRELTVRPGYTYRRGRIKVAIDGEVIWLRTPLEFRIAPRPLKLLLPREPA
jgi:diacylglycerol kinase family enzyme